MMQPPFGSLRTGQRACPTPEPSGKAHGLADGDDLHHDHAVAQPQSQRRRKVICGHRQYHPDVALRPAQPTAGSPPIFYASSAPGLTTRHHAHRDGAARAAWPATTCRTSNMMPSLCVTLHHRPAAASSPVAQLSRTERQPWRNPFIGQISTASAAISHLTCLGLLSRPDSCPSPRTQALFAIIGTFYGGNGTPPRLGSPTSKAHPPPMHWGTAGGLPTTVIGEVQGSPPR